MKKCKLKVRARLHSQKSRRNFDTFGTPSEFLRCVSKNGLSSTTKPKWALVTDFPHHWGKVPSQTTIAENTFGTPSEFLRCVSKNGLSSTTKPKWALVTDFPHHWGKVPSQTTIAEIFIQRTSQTGSQSVTPIYFPFIPMPWPDRMKGERYASISR